jgi:pyruvate kinase
VLKIRDKNFLNNNVVVSACRLARDTEAKAIIGMTSSGYTAFRISSHRPKSDIFIFTGNKSLLNTVSLLWGVRGYYYDKFTSTDETFLDIQKILVDNGHVSSGDVIINTVSMPINKKQRTNTIKLSIAE